MPAQTHPPHPPRWLVAASDAKQAEALSLALGCPPAIARLLIARGLTNPQAAEAFFHPGLNHLHSPWLLKGMTAAVARIRSAVAAGEPILIYGDYDVDGTTATVLLKTAIERIAPPGCPARVTYHVPHRLREGYGMQSSRLADAAADGVRLVISVDTGIRAFAQAREARTLGLDLIVTDHHLPDGEAGIPDAVAVVNPAQPGCAYPEKNLCGAAVAFKLAHALLESEAGTPEARERLRQVLLPSFLKLVALATVADSVAMTGENRAMTTLGLAGLGRPVQPGLKALMLAAGLEADTAPTAGQVGFRLAPRINAAGRMDVASDVVELFLTRDAERATTLAAKLDQLNTDRRAAEAAALEAIELQLLSMRGLAGEYAAECIVLDHPEWHRGVIGILAARVVERTGRPAVVIACEGMDAHGSGRSIAGFHLLEALTAVHGPGEGLFSRFGGHAHAVGFSMPADRLPLLRERMRLHSMERLPAELLAPPLVCDVELDRRELTPELPGWLERFAPFGNGNPEPVLLVRGLELGGLPRIIKDRHTCLPLTGGVGGRPLSALGWSRSGRTPWSERVAGLAAGARVDAVCTLRDNRHPQYGGVELELLDLEVL